MSRRPSMPRLDHELVLVRPEARQVEHQRLVAPHQDVVGVGGDLVGQRLATGRRLRDLQEQTGREDALMVEPLDVGGLDARQLVDRRHGTVGLHGPGSGSAAMMPWRYRSRGSGPPQGPPRRQSWESRLHLAARSIASSGWVPATILAIATVSV